MVLIAQRHNIGDGRHCAGYVDDRQRVVFLQRHIGFRTVRRDGDVFRLQVLGHRRTRPEDTHTARDQRCFLGIEAAETSCLDRACCDIDDRHRPDRIDVVIVVRLPFVCHQQLGAVLCESHHVRVGADSDFRRRGGQVGCVIHQHRAVLLDVRCGRRDCDLAVLDRDAVDAVEPARIERDRCDKRPGDRIQDVDTIAAGNIYPLIVRIMRDDLGRRARAGAVMVVRPYNARLDDRRGMDCRRCQRDNRGRDRHCRRAQCNSAD